MDTIRIAGREFKAVTDSTLAHDIWVIERLKSCGLENAVKSDDETVDEFVQRILLQVASGGAIFDLLGGLLMPAEIEPLEWTPALAQDTGRIFAATSGDDKAIVRGKIAEAMASFLAQGLLSSIRSQKSSTRAAETTESIE